MVTAVSSAGAGTSGGGQNLNGAGYGAEMKKEMPQTSAPYMFDANALSLVFSKMTSIGHSHGVLDPNAIKSLLPQANEW